MPVSTFSIDDFLRRSLSDMWDGKMIGCVSDYYSPNVVVHRPGNETRHGSDAVMINATAWLSAFPDAQVFVDSIIWQGDDPEYRTSVRSTFVGHNSGPTVFGAATGKRVVISAIVNSRVRAARFIEQWVEYDEVDLIDQLGFEVGAVLQRRNEEEDREAFGEDLGRGVSAWAAQLAAPEPIDASGPLKGGDLVQSAVNTVWNGRLPGAVAQLYDGRYRAHINARQIFGPGELQSEVLELLAALPDLRVHLDDVICRDESDGQHTSSRWTLLGTNTGPSRYAQPSGRYLRLTGMTNHRIVDSRFRAGWTAYSELSLLRQLASKRDVLPENACSE